MRAALACLAVFFLIAFSAPTAQAGEPKKQPNNGWIPIPQPVNPPRAFIINDFPRPGSRDMWQYYGVDSMGRFRPRVILSPTGSYDMLTLEPFPWITNRSTSYLPSALGAPAGSIAQPPPIIFQPTPTPIMPYAVD